MFQFLVALVILLALFGAYYLFRTWAMKDSPAIKLEQANQEIGKLQRQIEVGVSDFRVLADTNAKLQESFEKLRFAKISGDVKLGQKAEHLAGLAENFPAPLHTLKFLGAPIDYVSIDLEKELIIFIEVKTGQSKLSDTQKKIRKIIKDKNVEFREFRI